MKWTEIALIGVQSLQFCDKRLGTIERRETADRIDGLVVRFDTGASIELSAAVDVSEQLEHPRVFVFEGKSRDMFLLFGGEKAYWLSNDGIVKSEYPLFREWGEEEFWTTRILEQGGRVFVIYEVGVLAIDEMLHVRWHKPKLLNDYFVAVENDVLKFTRDHNAEWFMRLDNGNTLLQGHRS